MAPFLSRRDLQFQLYEVLDTAALPQRPRFAEHSREVYDDVLNLAYNVARHRAGRRTLVFSQAPAWSAVADSRLTVDGLRAVAEGLLVGAGR